MGGDIFTFDHLKLFHQNFCVSVQTVTREVEKHIVQKSVPLSVSCPQSCTRSKEKEMEEALRDSGQTLSLGATLRGLLPVCVKNDTTLS